MQYVSPLLQTLRLQRYARQIRHRLRAWGLLAWVSQVPEGDFFIGFDSFEGFPKEAAYQGWEPGGSASTLTATTRYLRKKGVPPHAMNFVKGWYKDSLTLETKARLGLSKTSLVMIDCDLYTSSCDALSFCAPLLADKAVIFFDDWGWRADLGEIGQKEAFEEFLADFPEFSAEPLPSYLVDRI
jgi:O-methyltransferase